MIKLYDLKYIGVHPEDQSIFNHDVSEFVNIPTKTDYTYIGVGPNQVVYDLYDRMVIFWTDLTNSLIHANREPCDYKRIMGIQHKFIKILTICPFSVEYFNNLYGGNKFQCTFEPMNPKFFPQKEEKIYDVYYTGHFPCPISFALPIISKFKTCIVSRSLNTGIGRTYKEKITLNSQSKISIGHGLLMWNNPETKKLFPTHKAFEHLDEFPFVAQMKTRILEAAVSRSLILMFHDPWNMIESYFEPDVDFVYWYNEKDLEEKIHHILSHYDDYQPMIESAYNKVSTLYTTEQFFKQYLEQL